MIACTLSNNPPQLPRARLCTLKHPQFLRSSTSILPRARLCTLKHPQFLRSSTSILPRACLCTLKHPQFLRSSTSVPPYRIGRARHCTPALGETPRHPTLSPTNTCLRSLPVPTVSYAFTPKYFTWHHPTSPTGTQPSRFVVKTISIVCTQSKCPA